MLAGGVKVSIDVCGHLNVAMSHPFLHIFQAAAVIDKQACAAVAQFMETDMRQTVLLEYLCKMVCHMDKKIAIHTMELWLADLPVVPGHVQHGVRPVVIVSNDIANNFSPIVTVVPLTTNRKASTLPTHVCLRGYGLSATSIAKCEHIMALDKSCLIRRMGEVSDWYDRLAIQHALAEQLGIELQVNLAA